MKKPRNSIINKQAQIIGNNETQIIKLNIKIESFKRDIDTLENEKRKREQKLVKVFFELSWVLNFFF
jgi:hypothetical protein